MVDANQFKNLLSKNEWLRKENIWITNVCNWSSNTNVLITLALVKEIFVAWYRDLNNVRSISENHWYHMREKIASTNENADNMNNNIYFQESKFIIREYLEPTQEYESQKTNNDHNGRTMKCEYTINMYERVY